MKKVLFVLSFLYLGGFSAATNTADPKCKKYAGQRGLEVYHSADIERGITHVRSTYKFTYSGQVFYNVEIFDEDYSKKEPAASYQIGIILVPKCQAASIIDNNSHSDWE